MTQSFTPELLIKYLYQETSASETLAVNDALHNDPDLLAEYEDLQRTAQYLPKVKFQPSAKALQNILRYSNRAAAEKTA